MSPRRRFFKKYIAFYCIHFSREIDDMIQEDFTPDSEGSLLDDSLDGRTKQVLHSPLYEESKCKIKK